MQQAEVFPDRYDGYDQYDKKIISIFDLSRQL